MTTTKKLLSVALALVVLGVVTFLLQPGRPEAECAPESAPSSGWVDAEKNCPITVESSQELNNYDSSPKPFRIAGLVLVLAGVVVAVVALVRGRRRSGEPGTPAP